MRKIYFSFCFCMLMAATAFAQEKHQYNFAQSYFGVSTQVLPGNGKILYENDGKSIQQNLPAVIQPRIEIGGIHFWHRADFYISIPVAALSFNQPDYVNINYGSGVLTGARFFFIPVKRKNLSPFAGFSWSVLNMRLQKKDHAAGPEINRHRLMLEAGLTYVTNKSYILDFTTQYLPINSFVYPISRTSFGNVNFPQFTFSVSCKKAFDLSNNLADPEVKKQQNALTDELRKKNKISGITIGVGPSSAFNLSKNKYNLANRQFLTNPAPVIILPDFSIGYYFHGLDAEARLSYRPITQKLQAYDLEQVATRHSVSAEFFAFVANYKGFVPFIGAFGGVEFLSLRETDDLNNEKQHFSDVKPGYGIVGGWDIRLNDAQPWLLRTNIRYTPNLYLSTNKQAFDFSHLEVNFIQFVLYPQRLETIKNFNKTLK